MKLQVTLNNQNHNLELTETSDGCFKVNFDGQDLEVKVEPFSGWKQFLMACDHRHYAVQTRLQEDDWQLQINGKTYQAQVEDELSHQLKKISGQNQRRVKPEIKAAMPGIVTQVKVNAQQKVKKDEVLLCVEAMKMENEIKAPHDGVVTALNVKAQQVLEGGEVMVVLEPLQD